MGFIGDIIGETLGGITGAKQSAKAAEKASQTQANVAQQAILEQRAAREEARGLNQPFVDAGSKAIAQQMALIGLNGTAAQQEGINALLTSPEYTTGVQQGEEAILANAAATGGLRGGNTQNSLARFRADLLANTFANQFNRLNTVSSLGQNAAAGTGNNAIGVAGNIANLLQQQGAAVAGGQLAQGNVVANTFNSAAQIAKAVAAF